MQSAYKLNTQQRKLVEDNLAVVDRVIRQYIHINPSVYGLNYDDLFQEGCICLCHAAFTFDDSKSSFSTYAKKVVLTGLFSYCRYTSMHERRFLALEQIEQNDYPGQVVLPKMVYTDDHTGLELLDLLEASKYNYSGSARKGIEALALRVQGQSLSQISARYGTDSRNVGAWISRAASKLRSDPEFLSCLCA